MINTRVQLIFDVDGTLVESFNLDEALFCQAFNSVVGVELSRDWESYPHVTDSGIVKHALERLKHTDAIDVLLPQIRKTFFHLLRLAINSQPIQPVAGALNFFNDAVKSSDIDVAIATGGWKESALMKLTSASFDISNIRLVSSDDHCSRDEILLKALRKPVNNMSVYFGDGNWDKDTCARLNIPFIGIGERVTSENWFQNFDDAKPIWQLLSRI